MVEKCRRCGIFPLTMPSGSAYCGGCKTTAPSMQLWDEVMAKGGKTNITKLIESIRDPIVTLNAIVTFSDDPGLKRMAVAALNRINALDVGPFFTDPALAEKVERQLKQLLKDTTNGTGNLKKT